MKRFLFALVIVTLVLVGFGPARMASASPAQECSHEVTIQSLSQCVHHAYDEGLIDNQGVALSLLAKLDAAQAAQSRGSNAVAVNLLQAFINEVRAQSGVHIQAMHAEHMIMHAQMVIEALRS